MTDRVNPISPITLGALEDLGYSVNAKLADRYALPRGDVPDGLNRRPNHERPGNLEEIFRT